ncbi:GTPase Era [Buchnera aphidicola (Kurisakia onigurumii)]|uniref:GTPase Era n=1 Tax=Buchnera aphidicola TaxID=9 RepID=UPI0031B68F16
MKIKKYAGKISIVGRPNVGKSTLMNKLIKKKISIVTNKKNTTTDLLLGIHTTVSHQFIYIDTPGIEINQKKYFKKIQHAILQSKLIIFVTDNIFWNKDDQWIFQLIYNTKIPFIFVLNKIDKLKNKEIILSYIKKIKYIKNIIPISTKKKKDIKIIFNFIKKMIPSSQHIFEKNIFTDKDIKFSISEIIREKFMIHLNKELPYAFQVKIESFNLHSNNEYYIKSYILVKNERYKKIMIGINGKKIKKCSIQSRIDIKKILKKKIHLFLWIKINK